MFEVIKTKIEEVFRMLDLKTWGTIIFTVLMVALIAFLYSTKGSKKEKLIKNYFLFYVSILLAVLGIVLTVLLNNYA